MPAGDNHMNQLVLISMPALPVLVAAAGEHASRRFLESFARTGAAVGMAVEDVYTQNRRLLVRLREKGGKRHAMPCHHNLEEYLVAYLAGAGLRDDPKGPLFRTIGPRTGLLTRTVLPQGERLCDDPPPSGRRRD